MRIFQLLLGATLLVALALPAQTRYDTLILVGAQDTLDATYFIPNQIPPSAGFPGIFFVHGFGLSKDADTANCRIYAAAGYITLCYSVRGHGKSSGTSMIMANQERGDLTAVVNFIRQLPGIDTARIGISGGSQGGLHGLWAVADRLPLAAVSSDAIVPRWASDMLMNGSIRRTAVLLLNGRAVRYNTTRDSLWNLIRADDYDGFAAQFIPTRDLDTAQLNAGTIPTLRLLKWQDHYFAADDGIASFERYGAAKKLYLGTRGHFSDQVESERPFQDSSVTRWFSYYLKGEMNGVPFEPTYTYAFSSLPMDTAGYFTWTRTNTSQWPPSGIAPVRFYLAADSALRYTPPTIGTLSYLLENRYLNPAYTFDTAYIEGFRGNRFDVLLPQQRLVFDSPPLTQEVTWIGAPKISLHIQSNGDVFPLHAQVYEVDSLGAKYFINRINFTARHWVPGDSGLIEVQGIPHAHRFRQGSRIRIEVTNMDKTNRVQLGTYPFVLPVFRNTGVTIFADAAHPSYIELPLIGSPTFVADGESFPREFALLQNYPNPFNPRTRFKFQVSSFGRVRLNVFDLLGREVATVVDEELVAGIYVRNWDAGNLPSGVYYYRLTAGRYTETRKALLLR